MKLYGVKYQMYYEYEEVEETLYTTREEAIQRAEKRVKEENTQYKGIKKVREGHWGSGEECITIVEFTVKQ
jgi:hypothetical protein